jgi:hypothetical protein
MYLGRTGPFKKSLKNIRAFFSPAQLAQFKNGSGWACPPGFGLARLKLKKKEFLVKKKKFWVTHFFKVSPLLFYNVCKTKKSI